MPPNAWKQLDPLQAAEPGLPRVPYVEVCPGFCAPCSTTNSVLRRGLMERDDWKNLGLSNLEGDRPEGAVPSPSPSTATPEDRNSSARKASG